MIHKIFHNYLVLFWVDIAEIFWNEYNGKFHEGHRPLSQEIIPRQGWEFKVVDYVYFPGYCRYCGTKAVVSCYTLVGQLFRWLHSLCNSGNYTCNIILMNDVTGPVTFRP